MLICPKSDEMLFFFQKKHKAQQFKDAFTGDPSKYFKVLKESNLLRFNAPVSIGQHVYRRVPREKTIKKSY